MPDGTWLGEEQGAKWALVTAPVEDKPQNCPASAGKKGKFPEKFFSAPGKIPPPKPIMSRNPGGRRWLHNSTCYVNECNHFYKILIW